MIECAPMRVGELKLSRSSNTRAAAAYQVEDEDDQRDNQQQVNETAANVGDQAD
jgi:hypothetical protein